jgi:hypothetical protein
MLSFTLNRRGHVVIQSFSDSLFEAECLFKLRISPGKQNALEEADEKGLLVLPPVALVASFKLIFSVSAALVRSKNRLPNSQNSRCR